MLWRMPCLGILTLQIYGEKLDFIECYSGLKALMVGYDGSAATCFTGRAIVYSLFDFHANYPTLNTLVQDLHKTVPYQSQYTHLSRV